MAAEVEFRREMNRNYMIMEPEQGRTEKYAARMLTGNRISGFLPFHEKRVDGRSWFYYDVTSKQPLGRLLEFRSLSGDELGRLLSDLLFALKELERYLLDGSSMELRPEFIYVEPDSFKSWFCFVPGRYGDFSAEFCELSQYLLDHVNHRDGAAVVLAFSVFKESRKENFGVEDIEKCLRNGEEKTPEKETGGDQTDFGARSPSGLRSGLQAPRSSSGSRAPQAPIPGDSNELLRGFKNKAAGKGGGDESMSEKMEEGGGYGNTAWISAILAALMIVLPVAVIAFRDFDGLFQYRWILGAAELCLGGACIGFFKGGSRPETVEAEEKPGTEEPWEIWFEEEDVREELGAETRGNYRNIEMIEEEESGEAQTALLAALPIEPNGRRLVSVTGKLEIAIGYFPFLIGRSRDMTDFCLDESDVSRLHIKIEERENGYFVTDLNSTNGTRVNGRLLAANETCELPVGGELEIAGRKFRFQ